MSNNNKLIDELDFDPKLVWNVYNSLIGTWIFNRQLDSTLSSTPSGFVTGKVNFTPITSVSLHYNEIGSFTTTSGNSFDITASYIYNYNISKNSIEIYFPKTNGSKEIGNLFVSLDLIKQDDHLISSDNHLCIQDNYNAEYKFHLSNFNLLDQIDIIFNVNGPAKNYLSITKLTKDSTK